MIQRNAQIKLKYDLNNLHHVVVQASAVSPEQVYALQLLHQQTDTVVYRHPAFGQEVDFEDEEPVLYLKGNNQNLAGSHTQTWIYSGRENRYFVGVKPKKFGHTLWATQIARVNLGEAGEQIFNSNTQLPRLSYLNRAGKRYPGKNLVRVEAAISPDFQTFLIASIDKDHTGHFALYNLAEINKVLDGIEDNPKDINIENLTCLDSFTIPNFNSKYIASIQGYGIDNEKNIYISSQPSPKQNWLGFAIQSSPREIVKIPWGSKIADNWEVINLDKEKLLNMRGFVTEFEGIQVIDQNHAYLTVAYHKKYGATTLYNKIFEIKIEKQNILS
ncbi:class III bacteriocin [Lactobacillus rodentium]|uniref:Bacteriocin n=1 Tax=Lactobacillus rodentium TaxID=947835 RepID=A0A2Z6T9Y6_9LACO|nr:class III bacteriocin [Lactobacillus rodentium]MCR1894871.1 class III bacteriocin [Lactobacillus rodentium]GBG05488.1 bacteriocin [Lactobacillus rodentium]